jgi:hypothetical protein
VLACGAREHPALVDYASKEACVIRFIGMGLFVAAMLSLAACGGGNDDEEASGDSGAPTATSPAAAANSSGTSSSSGGGGADLGFFASAECRNTTLAMAQAMSSFAAPTGSTVGEDPFAELAASLGAAGDAAPDDIKNDLETLAEAFAGLASAIEDAGGWNPASGQVPPAAVMQAFESFESPAVDAAGENVGVWFEENCES